MGSRQLGLLIVIFLSVDVRCVKKFYSQSLFSLYIEEKSVSRSSFLFDVVFLLHLLFFTHVDAEIRVDLRLCVCVRVLGMPRRRRTFFVSSGRIFE